MTSLTQKIDRLQELRTDVALKYFAEDLTHHDKQKIKNNLRPDENYFSQNQQSLDIEIAILQSMLEDEQFFVQNHMIAGVFNHIGLGHIKADEYDIDAIANIVLDATQEVIDIKQDQTEIAQERLFEENDIAWLAEQLYPNANSTPMIFSAIIEKLQQQNGKNPIVFGALAHSVLDSNYLNKALILDNISILQEIVTKAVKAELAQQGIQDDNRNHSKKITTIALMNKII